MHYSTLVILDERPGDVEAAVGKELAPFGPDGSSQWDWWQIGGRWTGHFDGYKPTSDPQNIEVCNLCGGTGDRADLGPPEWKKKCGGCNGCQGKGTRAKWPTQWAEHGGDIVPVKSLTKENLEVCNVCTSWGWYSNERWEPWSEEGFKKQDLPTLEWLKETFADGIAVIVDCHN